MVKQTLLRGLKLTIPLMLTFLILIWSIETIEGIFSSVLKPILPFYFPGLGALLGLAFIFLVGLLINAWIVQSLWEWGERGINKIPFVKTIYSSITDIVNLMDQTKNTLGTPVIAEFSGVKILGFITADNLEGLNMPEGDIAVYIPMSYQIGGLTVIMSKDKVTPFILSTQESMKFILTAGVTYAPEKHRDE